MYLKNRQKSPSAFLLSFVNVQLTLQWFPTRCLVSELDQYKEYDDGVQISLFSFYYNA